VVVGCRGWFEGKRYGMKATTFDKTTKEPTKSLDLKVNVRISFNQDSSVEMIWSSLQ
jgi:hypothetical protein